MTATLDCERCQLPIAVIVGPGELNIRGQPVRTRRYLELPCTNPHCRHTNRWHGPPAVDVQDVHHGIEQPPPEDES